MDYEKAYKHLIAKVKNAHLYAQTDSTKSVLEDILPELSESEDERIIDGFHTLLKGIRRNGGLTLNKVLLDKCEAWLEKQKEQKPEHLELKAGKWYVCHRAFCCRADHLTVKEGERFQCDKDGIVKGFVIKEPEKYFIECSAPAPMEDEHKEQKPVKINDDTEVGLDRALQIVKDAKGNLCGYQSDDGIYECDHAIQTLERILKNGIEQKPAEVGLALRSVSDEMLLAEAKYRGLQKPAEWSEEDDACYNLILKELENSKMSHPYYSRNCNRLIEWFSTRFKSLRPQPHWKPSEEQMAALVSVRKK